MQAPDSSLVAPDTTAAPETVSGALSLIVGELTGWWEAIVTGLPSFFVALLIVVITALIARGVRNVVKRLLTGVSGRVPTGASRTVINLLSTLAYVGVLSAGTFIALGVLGLSGVVATLLAGAGVIGLALGFAFQDIASNFISGVLLAVRSPFDVGAIIKTNDFEGIVEEVNLRATHLRTFQGQLVIIPNSSVLQNPLINYTSTRTRRVDLACGVGYGDDLELAERVAKRAGEQVQGRDESRDVEVFYTEFGDSSINLVVRIWLPFSKQTDFLKVRSDAIKALKAAFDAEGVTIPFPIRTLDFDPNGGVPLTAMLQNGGSPAGSASA